MDPIVTEWLNLILRWTHVITGIAWIGSSFFFMWLDSHLTAPETPKAGVEGELWMVHSGGFYQVEKMQLAPSQIPPMLHWFIWEATFTWITGILLLGVVYYLGAGAFLIDPSVADLSPLTAIAIGLGTLAVAWVVYDLLWQSRLAANTALAATLSFLLLLGIAYGLTHVFSGRGAFIHVGAMLGTLMAVNVWVRIIPAQRELVRATKAGTALDPALAANAKRRSVHNNYMTLPVIFIMVSNHFPSIYGNPYNWAMLGALFLVGATVRHHFNLRNRGQRSLWPIPAAAVVVLALVFMTLPRSAETTIPATGAAAVPFSTVRAIIAKRCQPCHSATPSDSDFTAAPAGIKFDTPAEIAKMAGRINILAVQQHVMPLANRTGMTDAERVLLGRWIAQGAAIN